MQEVSTTERQRLERLARRVSQDYGYAAAAGLSEQTQTRMAAQYERLVDKLGYDPLV